MTCTVEPQNGNRFLVRHWGDPSLSPLWMLPEHPECSDARDDLCHRPIWHLTACALANHTCGSRAASSDGLEDSAPQLTRVEINQADHWTCH
jgi:hypothetical protein